MAAPFTTPHLDAVESALAGARAELSRQGSLSSSGYPELVVEVLRVDELPVGIQAIATGQGSRPLSRGSTVGVVGRAYVLEHAGGEPRHDTGDLRRTEVVVQGDEPVASSLAYSEAVRAAARELGEALVRRALGQAEPAVEPM